jgi:hypothetical protein
VTAAFIRVSLSLTDLGVVIGVAFVAGVAVTLAAVTWWRR